MCCTTFSAPYTTGQSSLKHVGSLCLIALVLWRWTHVNLGRDRFLDYEKAEDTHVDRFSGLG